MERSIAEQRADERATRARVAMAEARSVLTTSLDKHGQRCTSVLDGHRCMRPTGHHGPHEAHGADHRTVSWVDEVEAQ